jgi:hypothetical protein
MLFADPRIELPELRIDPELVRDLPVLVPVLIDQRPRRLGIDLEQVPDDRKPLRRVDEHQLRAGASDLFSDRFVAAPKARPAFVLFWREVGMRLSRNDESAQD